MTNLRFSSQLVSTRLSVSYCITIWHRASSLTVHLKPTNKVVYLVVDGAGLKGFGEVSEKYKLMVFVKREYDAKFHFSVNQDHHEIICYCKHHK